MRRRFWIGGDLGREGVSVITADPKSSGGARWSYLAAWAYAMKQTGNDENKAREFLKKVYANVPAFPSGARGATTTFVQNGVGDVLLAWENEALAGGRGIWGGQIRSRDATCEYFGGAERGGGGSGCG